MDFITPEQEALIPVIQEKWKAIALSTERIEHQKAREAVKATYTAIGLSEPEIIFCDSPYAALETIVQRQLWNQLNDQSDDLLEYVLVHELWLQLDSHLYEQLRNKLSSQLDDILESQPERQLEHQLKRQDNDLIEDLLKGQLDEQLWCQQSERLNSQINDLRQVMHQLEDQLKTQRDDNLNYLSQLSHQMKHQLEDPLMSQLWDPLDYQLKYQLLDLLRLWELKQEEHLGDQLKGLYLRLLDPYSESAKWICYGSWFDFCINVLNCTHESKHWELYESLVKSCGSVLLFPGVCFVCERPTKLSFDNENRFHAEGEPAIQFADGYSLYSYHGITLPEKYGKLPPRQWKAQWLLEESNAELRRVLIQVIGYAQISKELQVTELDSWQEYSLLKIDSDVDVEPIYLLKMTCPSTGEIYALRVPPDMESAREAISWVNWEIDPEDFAVQT